MGSKHIVTKRSYTRIENPKLFINKREPSDTVLDQA